MRTATVIAATALALSACGPSETDDPGASADADPNASAAPAAVDPTPAAFSAEPPEMPGFVAECAREASEYALINDWAMAERSQAFLDCIRLQPGVEATGSGLLYQVLREPEADAPTPFIGQFVCVHYRGQLMDGLEFDSSYARREPSAFPSDRLIRGWVEALSAMKKGEARRLFIGPDQAYGDAGAAPDIPGGAALVFDMELLSLLPAPARRCDGTE